MKFVARFSKKDIFASLSAIYGKRFVKYRQEWESSSRGEYLPPFPLCLNYELLDGCNLECTHCVRSVYSSNRKRLGWELFKKTIDEGAEYGLPSIKMGFGEPFMEKEIFEMAAYAANKGVMDIIVTTNGTLIDEEGIENILNSKITFLRISVDAATEETYAKIRGSGLNELEETVKAILIKREERGLVFPLVRLSFVVMEENRHEVEAFKDKWLDIADFIDFQDYLEPRNLRPVPRGEIKSGFFCPYPWQMVPVMADGDIRACCSWYGEGIVLGNAKEKTIRECWSSECMEKIREQIRNGIYTESCAGCVRSRKKGLSNESY